MSRIQLFAAPKSDEHDPVDENTRRHPDGVDDCALAYRVGAPVVLQEEPISQSESVRSQMVKRHGDRGFRSTTSPKPQKSV